MYFEGTGWVTVTQVPIGYIRGGCIKRMCDHSWKEVGVFSESFRGVKGVSGRAFLMRLFRDFSKGDE